MSIKQASKHPVIAPHIFSSVAKEILKLTSTYSVIRAIPTANHAPDAIRIRRQMLIKLKTKADGSFDKVSARMAAGGNRQPDGSYGETYAPTVDETSSKISVAAMHAWGYDLT